MRSARALGGLLTILSLLAGCSGQGRDTAAAPVAAPVVVEAVSPASPPAPVSQDTVQAMREAMAQRQFTLTWQENGFKLKAGLSRNGDRYYLPQEGQGTVQQGLRAWQVIVERDGSMDWGYPYAGGLLQVPGLDFIRANPQSWGPGPSIGAVKTYRRESVSETEEFWIAELPAEGIAVERFFAPARLNQLHLWVQNEGNTYLPTRFAYTLLADGKRVSAEGSYSWVEPVLPVDIPPPTAERALGLMHIWLGSTRDDLEPISFAPSARTPVPDGSEWVVDDGNRGVKYDPSGRVVVISQSQAGLINGLQIGDDTAAVVRYLGPADEASESVMVYRFPFGNRLEVYLADGKVTKFWAVAPGN